MDVAAICEAGRAGVLKALLQIKMLFEKSEPRYLLNTL